MKSKIVYSFLILIVIVSSLVLAKNIQLGKGEFLSISKVKEKWGSASFDATLFKNGDSATKAKMAYSLINSKKYIGKSALEVKSDLGDFSGHYFSEAYATYIIQNAEKTGDDVWQLVFLIDRDRKVNEVVVHKNCCSH